MNQKFDFIIIGGGFFGISLALFLSKITQNILIIEKEQSIMERSSKNNQARVHSGFHYPRSAVTSVKSLLLHQKFVKEFPKAIMDDFKMLYAIPKMHSKISSKRFFRTFLDMGASIKKSSNAINLFDLNYIDEVFECHEFAFDYSIVKKYLLEKLERSEILIKLDTEAEKIIDGNDFRYVISRDGVSFKGNYIFNITYGNINSLMRNSKKEVLDIKNELVEIALIEPPIDLIKHGVTVMDGPFFSVMPFPSNNSYSLSHVRYSVHDTWLPTSQTRSIYNDFEGYRENSNYKFMQRDAAKFLPCIRDAKYIKSIYEIKSVLLMNEANDGRPILFHSDTPQSKIFTVLGGKFDNIYDLFEHVKSLFPAYRNI